MKVLVACEFTGTVRDAFIRAGHNAVSCDLLSSESDLGDHYQGDVRDILNDGWDLMVAHPECRYLTNAGVRWLHDDKNRWLDMIDGALFFKELAAAPIERIAIENPIMHKYAVRIIEKKADQYIQPWMHGEKQCKAIGLHLYNLPKLIPTKNVKVETMNLPYSERCKVHFASPGENRSKDRSRFFRGVADAMANQWGAA
ncbi:MAG: hypothetical protein GY938_22985 [Ketobacter sp.]|nr:hypothetical protein [Ketobacter sp.]